MKNKLEIIPEGYLDSELIFSFSRSSGPGGQNVNKVNTKAELRFNISESKLLTEEQKIILLDKLQKKINGFNEIVFYAQSERSQIANKETVIKNFYTEINKALKPKKIRKKTTPGASAIEKRLKEKKENAEKKYLRKNPDL